MVFSKRDRNIHQKMLQHIKLTMPHIAVIFYSKEKVDPVPNALSCN